MPAETKAASLTVAETQRQVEALADQLRSQREEYNEALQREAAIAEILRAVDEPGADLARVFNVLIEKATQLCSASYGYVWLYDGERTRAVAAFAEQPFGIGCATGNPASLLHKVHWVRRSSTGAWFMSSTRGSTRRTILPAYREIMDRGGVRTLLHVPLRKGDELLGFITVYRQERRPFRTDKSPCWKASRRRRSWRSKNARLLSETA